MHDDTTTHPTPAPHPMPGLKPLVISAPFGNYIQPPGATPTLGTFTLHRRPGRLKQILKTVRYRPKLKAWVNKIGLRNPGIEWLAQKATSGKIDVSDKLVSIHGFDDEQWYALLEKIAAIRPMGIELNMSCPNVGEIGWPPELFSRAVATGIPVCVKVPPVNYHQMVEQAVEAGVRVLHCCNTLPVPEGGMSGRPLQPVALDCIRDLRSQPYGNDLTIIGGGGVYELDDIDKFKQAGANHIALGTKTMNPLLMLSTASLKPFVRNAERLFDHA